MHQQRHSSASEYEAEGSAATDYLVPSCERILENAKKASTDVISSRTDCGPQAKICELLERVNRMVSAQIRHLVFKQSWADACEAMRARGTPPTTGTVSRARAFLTQMLLEHGIEKLNINTRISGKDNRMYDNVMLTLFGLDLVMFHLLTPANRRELIRFVAENNTWLSERNAVIMSSNASLSDSSVPVLRYRVSQFVNAVYQLAASWARLEYSKELIFYLELLRIRFAQLLHLSYSGQIHDVEALRVVVRETADGPEQELVLYCDGVFQNLFSVAQVKAMTDAQRQLWLRRGYRYRAISSEYQARPTLLHVLCPVFGDMFRRIVHFSAQQLATDPQQRWAQGADNWRLATYCFGRWIQEKMTGVNAEGPSEYLQKYLLEMSLRPGEREVYSREYPAGTNLTDVAYVIAKYRRNEFDFLSRLKQNTFVQVIREELPRVLLSSDLRESPQLMLCLFEFLEMYTRSSYFGRMNLLDYWILESQLEQRSADLIYIEMPIMCQVFNYFQVHYKGTLYRCDSFIRSFLLWLKLIERDLSRKVLGCDISGWYEELLAFAPEILPAGAVPPKTLWQDPAIAPQTVVERGAAGQAPVVEAMIDALSIRSVM